MRTLKKAQKHIHMDRQMEGQTDRPKNDHSWSDGPTDPCTSGKRVFQPSDGWTDRQMDRQPENIMPPVPKGGGIKR